MDARIGIGISADVGNALSGLQKVSSSTTLLQAQFDRLQKLASMPNLSFRQQERLNQLLLKTQGELAKSTRAFQVYHGGLDKVTRSTFNANQASINFGRVVQDIPFGLQGVANNIDPLVASLGGPAGLGIAVSIVTSGLLIFGDTLKNVFGSIKQITAGNTLSAAFKETDFATAIQDVKELSVNIDLAKQGFLSKTDVLRQYNETLGESIGKASSLDEAEKLLTKNGEAYIRVTLLKSAANLAFAEAAQKALEKQKLIFEKVNDVDFITTSQEGYQEALNANKRYLEVVASLKTMHFKDMTKEELAEYNKLLAERRKIEADTRAGLIAPGLQKDQDKLEQIGKDFQAFAAKLAKDFNIDFFGFKDPKGGTDALEQSKRLAKAIQEVLQVPEGIVFKDFDTDKEALAKVKATIQGFFDKSIFKLKLTAQTSFSEPPKPEDIATTDVTNVYNRVGGILGEAMQKGFSDFTTQNEESGISTDVARKIESDIQKAASGKFGSMGAAFGEQFGKAFKEKAQKYIKEGLTPDEAIKRAGIEISLLELGVKSLSDNFGVLIDNVLSGENAFKSFGEFVKNTLRQIAAQLLKTIALAALLSLISGGASKGGKSFIDAFAGLLGFGGGRAGGGSVSSGRAYMVGENGREMFIPNQSGTIIPNGNLGGVGSGSMVVQIVGEFRQSGNDLVATIQQVNRRQSRTA